MVSRIIQLHTNRLHCWPVLHTPVNAPSSSYDASLPIRQNERMVQGECVYEEEKETGEFKVLK